MMGGQDRAWLETLAVGAAGGLPRTALSITFRAVFGFQCCVSLSCGVLKHVPCTLLPHSYALVTTMSAGQEATT